MRMQNNGDYYDILTPVMLRVQIKLPLIAIASAALAAVFFPISFINTAHAEKEVVTVDESYPRRLLVVPYPFYNDTIGAGLGVAAIAEGYVQWQTLSVASGLFSTEGTYLIFLMSRNYQLPWLKRLFLEPSTSLGDFKEIKYYGGINTDFPDERPGSNDSHENNFSESDGSDIWFDMTIKYLLPIGHGRDHILPSLKLEDGIPVSGHTGGEHWNPLKSGRTFIELEPFIRRQDLDDEETTQETAGIEVALAYNNTDFSPNPTTGNYLRGFFDRDWGGLNSSRPWSVWGIEFAQYFSLGATEKARQRVIAFNFWTVDCPTWNSSHTEDDAEVFHRPPTYKGANLGGLWRLRGYPATRFNDRSGIYYGLEYRHTLAWNPLKEFTLKGKLDADWLQLVGFGEIGRVAPSWNFDELHKDMKWSAGAGLRVMVNHLILRFDLGASDEDVVAQLFI
ncbi:MAG: BamA/TamA family outer membrane protein, partial [Nitrospiraceae bacterium]